MTTDQTVRQPLSTWRYWWEIIKCHPGLYSATTVLRIVIFAAGFQVVGLLTRWFFDSLTGNAPWGWGPETWAALFVAAALTRSALIACDMYFFFAWTFSSGALMRRNMFERILERPGAGALPGSTGEAISRFREDPDEVGNFTAWALFLVAQLLFAMVAVVIMVQISVRITVIVFLPLVLVVFIANLTMARVQKYREASRGATGQVTGFIGELFNSVQAIKLAVAEAPMLAHFEQLNESRRQTALKDRLFSEVLGSIFRNMSSIGAGFIMLTAGQALQAGAFTVGDFALFVYYLGFIADWTASLGMFLPRLRQASVALERMNRLLQGAPPIRLVTKKPTHLRGALPAVTTPVKTAADRLKTLTAHNLCYHFPGSVNGVENVSLALRPGSFTVVTGRVGSGKTTLIRTLLGLLPKDAGEVRWNGETVADLGEFLIPPRVAYTPQLPALFSETLRANILAGLPEERVDLAGALYTAVMEEDIPQLEAGLETIIGPRGVKLSGGQRQRTAAARMFIRGGKQGAELLVFDDLSSALDVETERKLWDRLFEQPGLTCLVVSHRRAALRRADHILVLNEGKLADEGTLDELLLRCPEMQELWQSESK